MIIPNRSCGRVSKCPIQSNCCATVLFVRSLFLIYFPKLEYGFGSKENCRKSSESGDIASRDGGWHTPCHSQKGAAAAKSLFHAGRIRSGADFALERVSCNGAPGTACSILAVDYCPLWLRGNCRRDDGK